MQVRPFNGSTRDASGIIEVDRETFGECDYAPEYIVALEAEPCQFAWVAEHDGLIVGFVSTFLTRSLSQDRWEIDELAVRPSQQGRGLGTRLVDAAFQGVAATENTGQARALIAARNLASQRAFAKNGFIPERGAHLLIYEVSGRVPRPPLRDAPVIRRATECDEPSVSALAKVSCARAQAMILRPENTYLLGQSDENLGYVELIEVRTLQYHGLWLESIAMQAPDQTLARALFGAAIEEAKRRADVDLIGYAVPPLAEWIYAACVSQGYHKVDEYHVYTQELHA